MHIPSRAAIALLILLVACGNENDGTPLGPGAKAASLRITPDAAALHALGDTVRLAAQVHDAGGGTLSNASISWSSLDLSVATVSNSGLVEAVVDGAARIVATSSSVADTAVVTVAQVAAKVEVSPPSVSVAKGDTVRLSAQVRDANGHAIDGASIVWSSGDRAIASVDDAGLVTTTLQGGETQITATSGSASGYATLAGLDELLFVSNRDGNEDIYAMIADGSSLTNLTNDPSSDSEPVWSPDGTRIAFTTDRDLTLDIVVMNADGSGPLNLTSAGSLATDFEPSWSPDGARIAFRSTRTLDYEIYVVSANGAGITNLTNHRAFGPLQMERAVPA